jgi:hypothetical protein
MKARPPYRFEILRGHALAEARPRGTHKGALSRYRANIAGRRLRVR